MNDTSSRRDPQRGLGSRGEDDGTPFDGSGLKINTIKTRRQLNEAEFESILRVTEKYLLSNPSRKLAPFTFDWMLQLHREMLGQGATMWPMTDLRSTESPVRSEYISAMKQADAQNLRPLIDLHYRFRE